MRQQQQLFTILVLLCLRFGIVVGAELRGHAKQTTIINAGGKVFCSSVIAVVLTPHHAHQRNESKSTDVEFVCELNSGHTIPIQGTPVHMERMEELFGEGHFTKSTIEVHVYNHTAYLPPGDITTTIRNSIGQRRSLLDNTGPRYVLAVRVTDKDGRVNSASPDDISNGIFATYGDTFTMKSQMEACSFGKFEVSVDYPVEYISQYISAPGVVDVKINVPFLGNDRLTVTNAAQSAVEEKLGIDILGHFHHVMFVFGECYTNDYAAFAYKNFYVSGYCGQHWSYVGVVMHELGHNLNLGHSGGLDGGSYSDHTCLLGSPYYSSRDGRMCYNSAKNFQLARGGSGWYNENNYDTVVWNSGVRGGTSWSGSLIGVADYHNNPNKLHIVVKLETGTPNDFFVGFNRASGVNQDVLDARDKVTVIQAGHDGLDFSQSRIKAVLSQGESFLIANWRDSGLGLIVFVKKINLDTSPGYADVIMSFEQAANVPTYFPTSLSFPTYSPTSIDLEPDTVQRWFSWFSF